MTQSIDNNLNAATATNNEQSSIAVFNNQYPVKAIRQGFVVLEELEGYLQKTDATQYESLLEDISKNGIHSPVLYFVADDKHILVDGQIRLKIAEELNLESIPSLEIKESFASIEEVKIWMVKNQCQRRNLSKNVRVKFAYALKDSIAELARKNLVLAGKSEAVVNKVDTLQEIAKIAGVSKTTIARYQRVLEKGSEETKHQMVEGDISINNAFEQVKQIEKDSPSDAATETLKTNYFKISSIKEGTGKLKSGDLDCLMIVSKGRESLLHETDFKTGLIVID
jgi:ParB family chromosome partitioning protein